MSVCIVSFSSRKNGNCSQIGEFIRSQIVDAKLYDFSTFTISPCGECVYQCFRSGSNCPFFDDKEYEMLDAITNSEITYFIVPNYCDFPCSNFFIFNERSLCYFQNYEELLKKYLQVSKKFLVVSNSNYENFKTAFSYHTDKKPDILCLSANSYGKSSVDGNLLSSKQAVDDLRSFIFKK